MAQGPPSTLGKYQIIREIARSNDIVYEAWDPVMNRRVAVKELAMPGGATPAQKEDRIRRFSREAQAAGRLVHPHIVTVFEVGQQDDRHFIVMEFLDGRTLKAEIEAAGAMSPERAVEVATSVLKALEFAHGNGVIHRDVKPENIQILENGQIKLTDFGIARLTFEPNLTMDGQVFGTPSYMSPEQIHGKDIDARSDLFSVGIILYEMVAGKKPFTGDNVMAISYAIMNTDPPQPPSCPYGLWKVIKTALEKTSAQRYANAEEMRAALKNCLAQSAPAADPSMGQPGVPWSVGVTHQPYANTQNYGMPTQPNMMGGGQIVVPTGAVNPYAPPVQLQPPVAQPYGQPPVAQPYGQPITQPYGQAQSPYVPTTYAPYQPTQSAPIQVPVYYPPPPRKPLFKAETLDIMKNILLAVVSLGLVTWLILAAINVLGQKSVSSSASPAVEVANREAVQASQPTSQELPKLSDTVNGAIVKDAPKPASVDAEALIAEGKQKVDEAVREDFATRKGEIMAEAHGKFAQAIDADPARKEDRRQLVFAFFLQMVDASLKANNTALVRFYASNARSYVGRDAKNQELMRGWEDWIRANPL
jgi:serine/threonine-protein kinase